MSASASVPEEPASMNASSRPRVLVIGIGNPLRSDDGLGWIVSEQLARDGGVDGAIRTVHQLTPELAQETAGADLVVLIDACREGEPGELRVRPLTPPAELRPTGTHATSPEELAALTTTIYGHCPPMVIVTMTGADFSLGEQCSALVAERLPLVCAAVRQVCAHGF